MTPIIFTPPVQPAVLPASGRLTAALVAAGALGVLLMAVAMRPAAGGLGTHQALGLQPCQFLAVSGLPCPSCGMTTSYAYFVRGQWLAAMYVQPMGFILAVLTSGVFWAASYEAATGKPIHRLLRQLPMLALVGAVMGLAMAAWAWKIFIHLRGMDGWG